MPISRLDSLLLRSVLLPIFFLFAPIFANGEFTPPANYYANAHGLQGESLKAALHEIIRGHTIFPYTSSSTDTWDILKDADRDPSNPENVWLVYNGQSVNAAQEYNGGAGWNREHVWPQSLGGFNTNPGPGTDAHNLRACNIQVNSRRGSLEFDYGGSPVTTNGLNDTFADSNSFEPSDEFKGDVARIIFYMSVRYEGGNGEPDLELDDFTNRGVYTFGKLSSLIEWHLLDPVDDFERRRNARIFQYQGNRNPFIDNPEFVVAVFQPSGLLEEFDRWLLGHELPVSGSSDLTADSDGDGFTNWQEFAFGTSPVSGEGQQIESHFSDGNLTFRFLARSSGFNYTIENTSDLRLDFDDGNIPMVASPVQFSVPSGYTKMEFTVPASGSGFYRIRASEN
jgi:endonuclease I